MIWAVILVYLVLLVTIVVIMQARYERMVKERDKALFELKLLKKHMRHQ